MSLFSAGEINNIFDYTIAPKDIKFNSHGKHSSICQPNIYILSVGSHSVLFFKDELECVRVSIDELYDTLNRVCV